MSAGWAFSLLSCHWPGGRLQNSFATLMENSTGNIIRNIVYSKMMRTRPASACPGRPGARPAARVCGCPRTPVLLAKYLRPQHGTGGATGAFSAADAPVAVGIPVLLLPFSPRPGCCLRRHRWSIEVVGATSMEH
jgi:hypothetical protein